MVSKSDFFYTDITLNVKSVDLIGLNKFIRPCTNMGMGIKGALTAI